MFEDEQKKALPAYCWSVVLFLVVTSVGLVYWGWMDGRIMNESIYSHGYTLNFIHSELPQLKMNVQKTIDTNQKDNGQIIFAGSSLLRSGIFKPEPFPEYRLNRIFTPGASYSDFSRFIDLILQVEPEYLVIQTDLLTINKKVNRLKFQSSVQHSLKTWFGFKGDEDALWWENQCQKSKSILEDPSKLKRIKDQQAIYENSFPIEKEVSSWLEQKQQGGTKIILLDIPRSDEYEVLIGSSLMEWRNQIDALGTDLNMLVLRPEGISFPDTEYCDSSHMDIQARQKFTTWLYGELIKITDDAH